MSFREHRSGWRLVCGSLCILGTLGFLRGMATGQVVINELLAQNDTWIADDYGEFEDWAELLNTGDQDVSLLGWGMTDTPVGQDPWLFPDVVIPAHGYLLVWLSGRDQFSPPPEVDRNDGRNPAFRPVFVPPEAEWSYVVADPAATGPEPGWNDIGFDSRSWAVGRSGFGYGDEDDYTELPVDTGAVFIRTRFTVEEPASLRSLVLRMDYDDGFVAYLNGVRVAAEGFGPGDPDFQSGSSSKHEAGDPLMYDLSDRLDLLVEGTNVLAVVGLNGLPSSDMSLLPELGVMESFLHASFALEKDGEQLVLFNDSGQAVDSVYFDVQTRDHSLARVPDGSDQWRYLVHPTPEGPNEGPAFDEPLPDAVVFSEEAGRYAGPLSLELSPNFPGSSVVRYTTDGSDPGPASRLYFFPLDLTANTVIRAAAFIDDLRCTPTVSSSYFFGGNIALPVLSVSMEPSDYEAVHLTDQGRGRGWEFPAYLEYFGPGHRPACAVPFGIRLHGGASRRGDMNTKKSYKCYFRGSYGAKRLKCSIIPDTPVDSFDKLVLRAGFNDAFRTNGRAAYIRDQLIRDVHQDAGALVAHGSWCSLYVNMEFRGLYNITERIDEDFLESYTDEEDWDVIKTGNQVAVGTIDEWRRARDFFVYSDLSQESVYRTAETLLDIENFTTYMLLNIWAQNHDWISNNWYAARPRRPDGKWIFLSWDAEFGIGLIPQGYTADTFEFIFTRNGYLRDFFENLLKSPIYRAYFAEEADQLAYTVFSGERVVPQVRYLASLIAPDIPEEVALAGRTVETWQQNVDTCAAFAQNRNPSFLSSIFDSQRYEFRPVTLPRLLVCDPHKIVNTGAVELTVRGVRLDTDTEFFFDGIPAVSVRRVFGSNLGVGVPFSLELEGFPVITVRNSTTGESSSAEGLLEVLLPRPRPTEVVPARGSAQGGDRVRIRGSGFLPGATVEFGGVPGLNTVITGGLLSVIETTTPPGLGQVQVVVKNHVLDEPVPAETSLGFTYEQSGFLRGDANGDGAMDISDPIALLGNLFLGEGSLDCEGASDANDSGIVDISDAVFALSFLFQGGEDIPSPYPGCGPDPTEDPLSCEEPGC